MTRAVWMRMKKRIVRALYDGLRSIEGSFKLNQHKSDAIMPELAVRCALQADTMRANRSRAPCAAIGSGIFAERQTNRLRKDVLPLTLT